MGIDAIDPNLLQQLARSGRMPTLRALLDSSAWTYTDNAPYIGETPWPSFFTAVNPARHGRYFHSQILPGTYRTQLFHPREVKAPPYWSSLSAAGKRSVVVDVPKTHVVEGLNGIQIVDWATHDQEITAGLSSWPPKLSRELDRRFGEDPIRPNDFGGNGPKDFEAYRDSAVENIQRKTNLVTTFLEAEEWDHFLVVFDEGHHVGHYAWHLHDEDHPDHDPELRARCGDPLEAVCVALDSALRQILERLEPDCVFAFFVSGGIGPNYHASYILDSVLRRLEGIQSARERTVNPLRSLWRLTPVSLNWLLTPVQNAARNMLMASDRRRRRAFTLPAADESGAIRINVVGRERDGLVAPGAEYQQFCTGLEEALMELKNIDSGKPVVERVVRVSDYCTGPYLDHLPDLIVLWNRERPVRGVVSERTGKLLMPKSNARRGIHTVPGMFAVRTARGVNGRLSRDAHLTEIAPTICAWMDVTLDNADGEVIQELAQA